MSSRIVLVTGSSRGIGRAIALRLAKDDWAVAVHYSTSEDEARKVADLLGDSCAGVHQADLSDPNNAVEMIDKVIADQGLVALVNNAGVYRKTDFMNDSEEQVEQAFEQVFNVNWHSPRRMIHRACQHFKEKGQGKILNIVSRVAHRGEPNASCYAASKAALLNLTRSLAVETAQHNIQHFAIAPGWVETAMAREGMENRLSKILEDIPLGRMATPEDCAAAAAYLLSDEATYLSGVVIDVNGASYLR
ncbi:MAG: SDR family oxidoreductase [Armatimonadetes bacterium]|nr:SDR family oxidoreductase [Armatimonadota bacterium]